jgi:hypothetical protein
MSPDDTLTEVRSLLELLPGIRVTWVRKTATKLRIGLAIEDPDSLAILAHIVVAANVPMAVEVAWDCPGRYDDPHCVRYDLRIRVESPPIEPPSELQLLGGMLARELKDGGQLPAEEADALLRSWNFAIE